MQARPGAGSRETRQPPQPAEDVVHAWGRARAASGRTISAYMDHDHLGVVLGFVGQLPMLQPPQQLLDPVTWREQHASQSVWPASLAFRLTEFQPRR